jgi:hypothetical protein
MLLEAVETIAATVKVILNGCQHEEPESASVPLRQLSARFETEHVPSLAPDFNVARIIHFPRKRGNGPRPKVTSRRIRLHDSHFPQSRETPPHFVGDPRANSTPAISTKNKKLRHVPYVLIAGNV